MENCYKITAGGRSYNPLHWLSAPMYLINRIYYICGGTAYYDHSDAIPLKPGFLYVFRASPEFHVSQAESDPVDHVYFDFFTYQKLLDVDYLEIDVSLFPQLKRILTAAMEDFNAPPFPFSLVEAYFQIVIYHLQGFLKINNHYAPLTTAALSYIHQTDISSLSVAAIANYLSVNVNYFIRCFQKDLKITPHRYIAMLKADMARAYIGKGMRISEVSDMLGFSSVSAFSTFFKNLTHTNPSQFK